MTDYDLTLDGILVPDIPEYDPPVGTKVTRTLSNKGGLTTRQVSDNVLAPWTRQRPLVVVESGVTGTVEYDANIELRGGVELTLGSGGYPGCKVTVTNTGDEDGSLRGGFQGGRTVFAMPPARRALLMWDGSSWAEVSGAGGNGVAFIGTAEEYRAARLVTEGNEGFIPSGSVVIIRDAADTHLTGTHAAPSNP